MLLATSVLSTGATQATTPAPVFSKAVAFDVSPSLKSLAAARALRAAPLALPQEPIEIRPERGAVGTTKGYSPDGALQPTIGNPAKGLAATIPSPSLTLKDSNQDNFNIFGGRVNPPDPVGDVVPTTMSR